MLWRPGLLGGHPDGSSGPIARWRWCVVVPACVLHRPGWPVFRAQMSFGTPLDGTAQANDQWPMMVMAGVEQASG